jgi:hypothetical protein
MLVNNKINKITNSAKIPQLALKPLPVICPSRIITLHQMKVKSKLVRIPSPYSSVPSS